MSAATHYRDCRVALLTRHGKEALVRAPLESSLGCRLIHTDAFDTDLLGSFTRERARTGSQIDAARSKALVGMERLGERIGLGNEGAFGPDPYTGTLPWDREVWVWVDQVRGIEVVGFAQGPAQHVQRMITSDAALDQFAHDAGFPQHHIVLRPDHAHHPAVRKGLHEATALRAAFAACRAESEGGSVFAENDLRAHANPTRQQIILRAAQDLIRRLQSSCPRCASPGFAVTRLTPGLACRQCGAPTALPVAEHWRCVACGEEEVRALDTASGADPGRCDLCNP